MARAARPVRVLGLTGPVAGGKSAVAEILERRGARVVDLDALGHELLAVPEVRAEVDAAFPEVAGIGDQDALRRRLADVVFADAAKLARLERILHGRMCSRVRELAAERRAADAGGPVRPMVVAGALVYEMGLDELCDAVVLVDAPRELRLRRARESRGWSENEVMRREAKQMPLEGKRLRADRVLDNSGTRQQLEAAVAAFWEEFGWQ